MKNILRRLKQRVLGGKQIGQELLLLPRNISGYFSFPDLRIHYIDPVTTFFEYKYIFEDKIYDFETSSESPMIIDGGGYIGMATMFWKKKYPNTRIKIFEPNPNVLPILKENLETNSIAGVEIIESGLGKEDAKALFSIGDSDAGSLVDISKDQIKIKINKLSPYLNKTVDLLKLNIEGAEGDVIEEIESKISNIKNIVIEYHCFDNIQQSLHKILTILDRNNFKYAITNCPGGDGKFPIKFEGKYKYFNLIYAQNMAK